MQYTKDQQEFIDLAEQNASIQLEGKAGTGKSFIVKELSDMMRRLKRKFMAVAPTGIAANNVNGQTIHSAFNITPYGVLDIDPAELMRDDRIRFLRSEKRRLLEQVETLMFDEVSMLRPDILDAVHYTLIKNGLKGLDKRQIIFVGDMKQLPPAVDDNTRSVLMRTYNGVEYWHAKIFKRMKITSVGLNEVVRQNDPEFIEALNIVRDGGKSEYFKQFVGRGQKGVVLAPHNETVKFYNERGLADQHGEEMVFTACVEGNAKATEFNLESEIRVKNGCKIMYLVNSQENPLRNGTLGTFVSHEGCHYIRVNNTDFSMEPVKITKKEYVYDEELDELKLKEIGSIQQLPFKLAYALSIHKSQGLTFDECTVDLRRPCFQKGQMYVALSRVKTPEGLSLIV